MALGELQVEVQVLVVAAHHVEKARRVGADFLAQLTLAQGLANQRGTGGGGFGDQQLIEPADDMRQGNPTGAAESAAGLGRKSS
mgnify:CR=1 FL=1